jgi:hypothetical protein
MLMKSPGGVLRLHAHHILGGVLLGGVSVSVTLGMLTLHLHAGWRTLTATITF